jgi:glyoxylate/hydroxypyruvate reductase A
MNILLYLGGDDARTQSWRGQLQALLPQSHVRIWAAGDKAPADYVLAWKPPVELFAGRRDIKAVLYLAAGVDYLAELLRRHPGLLPDNVPVVRMEDAGMGSQMIEFARYQVLRYFRQMHEYDVQGGEGRWQKRSPETLDSFHVGVMGLGVLGQGVATGIADLGFPVRGWSRTSKTLACVHCHYGSEALPAFLDGLRVLVNLLPLTVETENILDAACFERMRAPAYLVNLGRGHHLVEQDLLDAIRMDRVGGAALDVFREEPLPAKHPFWGEPRISVTPHIAAVTLNDEGVRQVVQKLHALQAGAEVTGLVDFARGY